MTHGRRLMVVAAGLALAGCVELPRVAPTPARESSATAVIVPATPSTVGTTPTATDLPVAESLLPAEAAMLAAINQQRRAVRCPALLAEARLIAIARAHAAEIAQRREASHRSVDGAMLDQRLTRGGYAAQRSGELIGVGRESPGAMVAEWVAEPLDGAHRREIDNCFYTNAGIGMARTDAGIEYWVIIVAEPA